MRLTKTSALAMAALSLGALLSTPAIAVDCSTGKARPAFTTCRVDLSREHVRLFYADRDAVRYENFARLRASLAREQKQLVFAMNAGMFHPDMKPVGLLVIDGREIGAINRATASGNFYLQPNGVFLIDAEGARVVATHEYRALTPDFATQSGPMLLSHGQIPEIPAFRASSKSRHIRNGVCAPRKDQAVFVISEVPVTFREFALYFRDGLGCTDALYFDGAISSLYAPQLGRADARAALGPIIAVVE